MDESTLRIRLPSYLTTTTFRQHLHGFPLRSRADDPATLRCEFAPLDVVNRIDNDATDVEAWTSEGLAAAAAFHRWLLSVASRTIDIATISTPARSDWLLDKDLRPQQLETKTRWRKGKQFLVETAVPRAPAAGASKSAMREAMEVLADRLAALVAEAYPAAVASTPTRALLFEFFAEGLLNVLEHADSPMAPDRQPVWIGARVYDSRDDLRQLLAHRAEDQRTDEWLSAAAQPNEQ